MVTPGATIDNLYQNARRALEKEDWEDAEKYYDRVEEQIPGDLEAVFYSAFSRCMLSLSENDRFKREQKFTAFIKTISILEDEYDPAKGDALEALILQMKDSIIKMVHHSYVYMQKKNGYGLVLETDKAVTEVLFGNTLKEFKKAIENIYAKDERAYLTEIAAMLEQEIADNAVRTEEAKKNDYDKAFDSVKGGLGKLKGALAGKLDAMKKKNGDDQDNQ